MLDPRSELTVSVVSAWEIALKPELGIADVAREAARHLQARILPVRLEHRGPFDRLLIAQAIAGQLVLITCDEAIARFPDAQCICDSGAGSCPFHLRRTAAR